MNYTEINVVEERQANGAWVVVWQGDAVTEAQALETMEALATGRTGSWRVVRRMEVTVGMISKARP